MTNIKIWESKLKDDFIYFDNPEDYFKYLTDKDLSMTFFLKDNYNKDQEPKNYLELIAQKNNYNLTFTDEEHPIVINQNGFFGSYINKSFFYQNKQKFIELACLNLENQLKSILIKVDIPDFINRETLQKIFNKHDIYREYLLSKSYDYYLIEGNELKEEDIQKIKDSHLNWYNKTEQTREQISTNKIINYYTLKELKGLKNITLYTPIPEKDLNNFIYLEETTKINIKSNYNSKINELSFFKELNHVFNTISTNQKNYQINFEVENRELLNQSHLLQNIPNNLKITISNDLYEYNLNTYLEEEKQLDNLIAPIKNANLSPLEKYLAVYNIVKSFKKYNENNENKEEARYLRYILNNEYIVCVGFQKLLKTLLDKVGIPSYEINTGIDTSYDNGFTKEDIPIDNTGHARNMIKIDDDKYNIHGIYLADATWDNSLDKDYYLNSLLTFDKKKEAIRLETLNTEDLLFDFHNISDFKEKLTYFITKNERSFTYDYSYDQKIIKIYQSLYNSIMKRLTQLDYQKYSSFYDKYDNKINSLSGELSKIEHDINDFLTEYAKYIIPLSNNKVDLPTIIEAAKNVKEKIYHYSQEQLQVWQESTIKENEKEDILSFPYKYNSNNKTEAYLETKESPSKTK